jgi:hypothetical protein
MKVDFMNATLKKGLYFLSFSILISLMASCLGNNTTQDTYPITDAELVSFSLTNDSIAGLSSVVFTIDQRAGLIYNNDSMAYRTALLDSVSVNYTSGYGNANNVLNITNGDSIWVKSGDSINIRQPLTFKVYALDGQTTKVYTVKLNIHQVEPDSLQLFPVVSELPFLQTGETKTVTLNNRFFNYSKTNNQIQLHTSSDAVNWVEETVSGLPANIVVKCIQSNGNQLFAYTDDGELYRDSIGNQWALVNKPASIKVKSILGYLNAGLDFDQTGGLCLIIETNGINTFAFTNDFIQWDYNSAVPAPDNFPLSDFSTYSYQLMFAHRVTVFGGTSAKGTVQNAVWSTTDGHYWAKLTTDGVNVFPAMEGANVFYYNDEFWFINGKSGNDFNKEVYSSIDGGITWQPKSIFACSTCGTILYRWVYKCPECGEWNTYKRVNLQLPDDYPGRYNASVVTDKDNKHFYIIGGKQTTVLPDIWNGYLNKMEFDH